MPLCSQTLNACCWGFIMHTPPWRKAAVRVSGMPIKACADRLRGEIEVFGNPPVFPEDEEPPSPEPADAAAAADPTKFKATKGKAAAKKGKGVTQWDILKNSGIPEADIHMFQCALPVLLGIHFK